ncbi:hypothetical protein BCR36DRAFT_318796, partial [Piromyces finnis]
MNNTSSYEWDFKNSLNNNIKLSLQQENEEIKNLSYLINFLTGIVHNEKNKIEDPIATFQNSWENLILNLNTIIKNGLSHKTQLIAYLWRKILYNVYITFYENEKYKEFMEKSIQYLFEQLMNDLNYKISKKNEEIKQNVLYSNSLLNYYDSDSDEEEEEEEEDNVENKIQKFQIKRRIKHIFNLLHMLLKDFRKAIIDNDEEFPIHIGDYIWIIFQEENFSTFNSSQFNKVLFSKQNFLEWTYEIVVIQIDLIKLYHIRNINEKEKDKFNLINNMPIFVINHIEEYGYIFEEDFPTNQTMIVRRILQLFNQIIIVLDQVMNFEKWRKNWQDWTTSNLSFENLLMGYSKYKIKVYPEIENLIHSYESNDQKVPESQRPPSFYYQLIYQKLSVLITIMKIFICFVKHSQIKNYIAHHLYDNGNISYTTFIHQPSCNAMLCQHQSYLDRECMCKFLLGINRWFFSMAKMDTFLIQNSIVDSLLIELTKDINISDIFSYTNIPEIIVNLYSHNDSELMDTLILLQNNFICYQYKSAKTLYHRCPVIATILEFSTPIKLFEALMHNISYDKKILLDWVISNETTFLEYLLRYLDYTELYCQTSLSTSSKNTEQNQKKLSNTEQMEIYMDENYIKNKKLKDTFPSNYYNNNDDNDTDSYSPKVRSGKRRMILKNNFNENSNSTAMAQEYSIQHLSDQLKYTFRITEKPSKETIELLSQLRMTIDKLSKRDLIPFSPGPLLRK